MKTKLFFSIVIPTLNEEKYLPDLLEDLSAQTLPKELFEVIVVDGHSDDKTVTKAQEFANRLQLTTINCTKRNVSVQRNLGAESAQSKWIIFMDADNKLPKYFLDGIRYRLAQRPTTKIFTTWSDALSSNPMDKATTELLNLSLELYNTADKKAAMGAMIGVKKKIWQEIKFDDTQKAMEDSIFVNTAHKKGHKLQIFQDPCFYLSFRRYKKQNTFKSISDTAMLHINYLRGKDFKNESRYKMMGGGFYDEIEPSLFKTLISQFKNVSTKKLATIQKLMNKVS